MVNSVQGFIYPRRDGNTVLMTDYAFFSAQLRFVARKTDRKPAEVAAMMAILDQIADQIDASEKSFFVAAHDLHTAARALAGVSGFLQSRILPEVIAFENATGEAQVRWTIDQCMSIMTRLLTHAELHNEEQGLDVKLTPPLFNQGI